MAVKRNCFAINPGAECNNQSQYFCSLTYCRAPLSNILAITAMFMDLPEENATEYRQRAVILNDQAIKLDEIVTGMVKNIIMDDPT